MEEILLAPATFDIAILIVVLIIATGTLSLIAKYKK